MNAQADLMAPREIEGEVVEDYGVSGMPMWNSDDPADLEAWFGNFGHAEHLRKVVLASAREAERAKALDSTSKITESRLDDLARVNPRYVQYLIDTLNGRRLREENVRQTLMRGGV